MVAVNLNQDPTLAAMAAAIEKKAAQEKPRPYLGASSIGDPCERKLFYRFRWYATEDFRANTLANFDDGHRSEAIMADRLRLVEGIRLVTHGPDGNQLGWTDLGGHFRGNLDGVIEGLIQAPKTPHVWEHKAVNPDKFKKLEKLKAEYGEKEALKRWDEIYYAQGQSYMDQWGLDRHYLTVCTAGSREWTSCRTELDKGYVYDLMRKAENIIASDHPAQMRKVSKDPAFYLCKWCNFSGVCHQGAEPQKNCRTCSLSEPTENGQWRCRKWKKEIPLDFQYKGCDAWNP